MSALKELWEMTQAENRQRFYQLVDANQDYAGSSYKKYKGNWLMMDNEADRQHKYAISKALSEGKKVPDAVLIDYKKFRSKMVNDISKRERNLTERQSKKSRANAAEAKKLEAELEEKQRQLIRNMYERTEHQAKEDMTAAEFRDFYWALLSDQEKMLFKSRKDADLYADVSHKTAVEAAVAVGRQLKTEVLADYKYLFEWQQDPDLSGALVKVEYRDKKESVWWVAVYQEKDKITSRGGFAFVARYGLRNVPGKIVNRRLTRSTSQCLTAADSVKQAKRDIDSIGSDGFLHRHLFEKGA